MFIDNLKNDKYHHKFYRNYNEFEGCDGDCLNCKYDDCIAPEEVIKELDRIEKAEARKRRKAEAEVKAIERKNKRKAKTNGKRTKGNE